MAEFALGLTKTAVAGAVSRVKLAIEEEGKLRVRVQDDLVFITGEFEMMQSFLNVASAERANNQVVRTWVRQLRGLAFDVEDCVEFVVHLDKASRWDWLRRLTSSLICMARPPLPLDVAAAEIQRLKVRVEDISQRNTRYNLISNESTTQAPEQLAATADSSATSAFHVLSQVWQAAGKKRQDMGDLKRLICSEGNGLEVISLWSGSTSSSTGGADHLGIVTSIFREAYDNQEIRNRFKNRAWVKLMHPFNPEEFIKSVLTQFYESSHQANIGVDFRKKMKALVSMEDELMQQVTQQRYLVILEDLSTAAQWGAIRVYLPHGLNGSRIVMATQQLGLALSCTGLPYQVSELSSGQSLCAFFNKAYRDEADNEESSIRGRVLSNRMEEARAWMDTFDTDVHFYEWMSISRHLQYPGVISVWGIAGVGKSALIKSIYYNQMLGLKNRRSNSDTSDEIDYDTEFTAFSWVYVPHPFDLKEFSWRLFLDFLSDDPEAKENATLGMMAGYDPFEGCRRFLHQQKCFVVIDALQSTRDWDLIKNALLLSKPVRGYIIVNTYEESVAAHCADDEDHVINIKGLEADAALHFFRKIAWGGRQMSLKEVEISKLILDKCGGLPKVIAAIGQYLSSDTVSTAGLEIINADFMGNLEKDPGFDNLRSLFSWMQSYFDSCSDSLKPCIFYLSVFPAGHKSIRPRRLVRRWIAEGYSRDKIGSTAEEDGKKLFSELIKLSVLQQSVSKVEYVCQVNGFFREYIISRPMEDNLVFALEGRCSPNSKRAGQHLTIASSWDRDKIVYESIDYTRLRSLTVFGKWMSFFVSDNMRLLRVLDLEDTSGVTDDDLKQISKLLPRLKFLSLRGCKEITRLPDSLCDMRQLQTLDFRYTSIVTLPANITKLQKLQYVRAGSTMPSNVEAEDTTVAAAAPPEANGDCTVPTEENDTSTSDQDDGTAPSLAAAANTSTPEADGDGMVPRAPTAATPPPDQDGDTPGSWNSRARDIVSTWLSNVNKLRRCQLKFNNGGVEVAPSAAGTIGKVTALHTLGVVNVCGAGGKVVLRELKKLTQLRKLRLSGINRKNWQDLCCAISGHGYLESLSLQLDDKNEQQDLCCLDEISEPPKTLKSLKLYGGNVHVSPVWMKQLGNLSKVRLEDLELTISAQEDIGIIMELPCTDMYRRLCVKPTKDGELRCGWWDEDGWASGYFEAPLLKIDCSTHKLVIVFGPLIITCVEVLVVHCSTTDSSLELSSGLEELSCLKKIWLTGSYSEATKQHLEQKVAELSTKPVLKLDGEPTRQYLNSICHTRSSTT